MDTLKLKHTQLLKALATLDESIAMFDISAEHINVQISHYTHEQLRRALRDSVIQRFEFCTELFWKYVKRFVEDKGQVIEYNAPVPVIRQAFTVGVFDEWQAEEILKMAKDRNRTSHIYKEEVAQELIEKIPPYAVVMTTVARRLSPT